MYKGVTLRVWHDGKIIEPDIAGVYSFNHEWLIGPYTADIELRAGQNGATVQQLKDIFDKWLMYEVQALYDGKVCWAGYIWQMDLQYGGFLRSKSGEDLANSVCSRYQNDSGETRYTYWHEDTVSIGRYGRHERIVPINGKITIARDTDGNPLTDDDGWLYEPEWRNELELRRWAHPVEIPSGFVGVDPDAAPDQEAALDIQLIGRIGLADRITMSDGYITDERDEWDPINYDIDGSLLRQTGVSEFDDGYEHGDTIIVSKEIERLIRVSDYAGGWASDDKNWLYPISIAENNVKTAAGVSSSSTSLWRRLLELLSIPNRSGEEMVMTINPDGGVLYAPKGDKITMRYYPGAPGLVDVNDEPLSWNARPGLLNIFDPRTHSYYGDPFVYVNRVSVNRDGIATPHRYERSVGDLWDSLREAKLDYKRRR